MSILGVTPARAEFTVSFQQVGADVVATGRGTINTAGLTKTGIGRAADFVSVNPKGAGYGAGIPGQPVTVFTNFSGLSGPGSFGSGNTTNANSPFSGTPFILNGSSGTVQLPIDYASGSSFSNSDIFQNKTLSSLGLANGTYAYTFGAGTDADAIIVQIGPAAVPPAPAATKVCVPSVPNMWRSVTPVPATWTLDDCRNMGQTIGATMLQAGCFFDKAPAGQPEKYSFGGASSISTPPTASNMPSPNCGW